MADIQSTLPAADGLVIRPALKERIKQTEIRTARGYSSLLQYNKRGKKRDDYKKKRKRCGVCDGCVSDDCKKCHFYMDKPKYGGSGKMKKCCTKQQCSKLISKSTDHSHSYIYTNPRNW